MALKIFLNLDDSYEIHQGAQNISNLMARQKKSCSYVDALIGAQLKKRPTSLFLVTEKNKDFTIKLFDRLAIYDIQNEDDIYTIGL